jgi:hypothetical protein
MAFSEDVKARAYLRSTGQCECRRSTCDVGHSGRCTKTLTATSGEYHHIVAGGDDTLSNCEYLCEPCHEATISYGRS